LECDFISHPERHRDEGFQTYLPRAIYGVGRGVELGLNVAATDVSGAGLPIEIQPNAKWQFFKHEERGLAAAAGGALYLPANRRVGNDRLSLTYLIVSQKLKAGSGPRVSGGGYRLVGRRNGSGALGGAVVGIERPLHRKITLVADWISGRNRFGYVGSGLAISLHPNNLLVAGYSVGNRGRKNNALSAFYGITC
jgi:hypothetical protein